MDTSHYNIYIAIIPITANVQSTTFFPYDSQSHYDFCSWQGVLINFNKKLKKFEQHKIGLDNDI